MTDKTSAAAGWVVEVVTLRQGGGPPLFKYFNVAAEVTKAVEATRKQQDAGQANRVTEPDMRARIRLFGSIDHRASES